jgi:peptide/nickel transport system substrate-binding protein
MRNRWFAGVLAGLVAASVLAGCAQKKASPSKQSGKVADGADVPERRMRELVLLSRPQAQAPDEFEFTKLIAAEMIKLGIPTKVDVQPWEKMSDVVWFQRDKWDFTGWQMVGRPERGDPDEFTYNLFHSSTAKDGYNFGGFIDPEYDKLAEAQRQETDPNKRAELIKQAQKRLADASPYLFIVHPKVNFAFNSDVFDPASIVDANGIGIKNFWSFVGAQPRGDKKDMVLNTQENVKAISPLYIAGGVDSWVYELLWDRLMRVGADGLPKPYAAETVAWKDEKTLEVTLRPGMKWHDGKPVTVDDVIFSFEAPMGDMAPMYKPFVTNIAKMEKIGENKIRFVLKQPSAAFLTATLAKINLIPKHVWEPVFKELQAKNQNAEKYQEQVPIGSGPFKFASWKLNEEIVLAANAEHWAKPKISRWIVRTVPNGDAALGMLESGEINFLASYSGDPGILEQKAKAKPNIKVVSSVEVGARFISFNLRRPPFDDKAFRQALQYLVNKQAIVEMVYKGAAVPAYGMISPTLKFWYNSDIAATYSYNPDKARETLTAAGYEWDASGKLLYPKGQKETLGGK